MDGDQGTGQLLAQYRLDARLGRGGMGSVYRAWDTQLHRWVAIKILTAGVEQAPDTRSRFLREARAVAALNHPNIVTIYEIGQSGPVDYIAMECVPGRTLSSSLLGGNPLDVGVALNYGIQIADAIAAAHAAGITHRDLKPANIMISDRGHVKVLDFGIAKYTEHADESDQTRTVALETSPGIVMGTPNYMSPEQAQGKPVDERSDIFALGAILYEMLTGQRAFEGTSALAVLTSILTVDPPPVSTIRPIPDELNRLVSHCLRKDVARRLQHADDLKIILQELSSPTPVTSPSLGTASQAGAGANLSSVRALGATPPAAAPPETAAITPPASAGGSRSRRKWRIGGAVLLAAVASLAGWLYWSKPASSLFHGATRLQRVTSDSGLSVWPTLSRDGKFIAYASDRPDEQNLHIWVQQIGGGQPIQLTDGAADDTEPSFSPDGTSIAFRSDRDGGGIYVVPTLGGEARLLARLGREPRFSPDGTKIAYSVGKDLGKIYIVNAESGSEPQPFHHEFRVARSPVWSPDGRSILFEGESQPGEGRANPIWDWWIAPAAGGQAVATGIFWRLREFKIFVGAPAAWLPGDRVLFSGSQESIDSVWAIKISARTGRMAGNPERLTFGTSTDSFPSAAGDTPESLRVAFSSISKTTHLWALPIDANSGQITGEMTPLTQGTGTESTQLTISADGRRIAFLSNRGGEPQPWIRDMASGHQTSVSGARAMWAPNISPDGRSLAWSVFVDGRPTQAYRAMIGPEGQLGIAETLCRNCGPIISWSSDGRNVVYGKSNPSGAALLELDTGDSYDLLTKSDTDVWGGRFSPDGKWLTMNLTPAPTHSRVYNARFDPERRAAIPFSEWIPITDGSSWDDKSRWSPDSKSMYFISERDDFRCIWRQILDPDTGQPAGSPTAIVHFHRARLSLRNVPIGPLAFQVAPDALIFSLGELSGNVWILSPDSP